MFGSEVIDVGIGMSLLFLFMSLIASALRELIENFMKSRATDLEKGIQELLQNNNALVQQLYSHPLITSLYKGTYVAGSKDLPSYIPRQSFSLAVLDLAAGGGQALSSVDSLKASLANVQNRNPLQNVVLTAVQTAQGDMGRVRKTIEDWYDGTMDRVSGWYTRRTGKYLGVIGLLAALLLNVDAITVTQRLVQDKALRQAVVGQAEKVKDQPSGSFAQLQGEFEAIGFPVGWLTDQSNSKIPYPGPQMCTPVSNTAPVQFTCTLTLGAAIKSALGWIATALAIMLGAPFWFDVLNKFMIVRSTIKPKEKSPDEASVDRQPDNHDGNGKGKDGDGGGGGQASPAAGGPNDFAQVALASAMAAMALQSNAFVPHEWRADPTDPQHDAEAGVI
jgi:hypothetical protein